MKIVYHCDKIKFNSDYSNYEVVEGIRKFSFLSNAKIFANEQDYDILIVECDEEGSANEDIEIVINTIKEDIMKTYDYGDFKEYGFKDQKELQKKHNELLGSDWELEGMETNDRLYEKDILYIIVARYTRNGEMTAVFMDNSEL